MPLVFHCRPCSVVGHWSAFIPCDALSHTWISFHTLSWSIRAGWIVRICSILPWTLASSFCNLLSSSRLASSISTGYIDVVNHPDYSHVYPLLTSSTLGSSIALHSSSGSSYLIIGLSHTDTTWSPILTFPYFFACALVILLLLICLDQSTLHSVRCIVVVYLTLPPVLTIQLFFRLIWGPWILEFFSPMTLGSIWRPANSE